MTKYSLNTENKCQVSASRETVLDIFHYDIKIKPITDQ